METTRIDTIEIQRKFNAAIEKVWQAWTQPGLISKWFGSDANGKVLKAEMDVRPAGSFEITFKDSDGTEHACFGVYHEVRPLNKLSFTWNWKSEPRVESFVTVLFTSEKESTVMQLEHAQVGTASAHNYQQGWESTFVKLQDTLATL